MQPPKAAGPANWHGKGLVGVLLLIVAAVAIVALASMFGIARDYGYLHASLLTGTPGGRYHALGTSLSARARCAATGWPTSRNERGSRRSRPAPRAAFRARGSSMCRMYSMPGPGEGARDRPRSPAAAAAGDRARARRHPIPRRWIGARSAVPGGPARRVRHAPRPAAASAGSPRLLQRSLRCRPDGLQGRGRR